MKWCHDHVGAEQTDQKKNNQPTQKDTSTTNAAPSVMGAASASASVATGDGRGSGGDVTKPQPGVGGFTIVEHAWRKELPGDQA